MIEPNQVYLLVAKIAELLLYFYVFLTLNKKYKGVPLKNRPSLHRFFLVGIAGWIFYMFFDTIIYVIAPLSIPESAIWFTSIDVNSGPYSGYDMRYLSLFIANILRDIALPGALIMAWSYCAGAVLINSGMNLNEMFFFAEDAKKRGIYRLIAFIFVGAIVALDRIAVHVISATQIHVTSAWGIINSLALLGFFTLATILMIKQLNYLRTTPMEKTLKRRAQNLGWGIITFTAGLYYWGLTGVIFQAGSASDLVILIFLFLGHIIWSLSAVFIFLAFKSGATEKESSTPSSEQELVD